MNTKMNRIVAIFLAIVFLTVTIFPATSAAKTAEKKLPILGAQAETKNVSQEPSESG
jgi:hypothetical protein